MSKIVVLSYGYPNTATPTSCPFLKELVQKWIEMGLDVEVINPLTLKAYLRCKRGDHSQHEHYPLYFSFGILRGIPLLRKFAYKLSDYSFQRAAEKILLSIYADDIVLYAHFLNAGYIAGKIAYKKNCKAYCAFGESELWSIKGKEPNELDRVLNRINGYISVSKENTQILLDKKYTTEEKILYAPNGVDLSSFYAMDKKVCREKLGFLEDCKIGVFVGHFIDRKGPLRVNEATKEIPGLKMIYIGGGEQVPENSNIIFCGKVPHEKLRHYLSAADFFVLPTKAEGCCNAIIEAMACGLPIISSKGFFNDDILEDNYSIRVNPMDIEEIRCAIKKLVSDDTLRNSMHYEVLKAAKRFSIEDRAKRIAEFIDGFKTKD